MAYTWADVLRLPPSADSIGTASSTERTISDSMCQDHYSVPATSMCHPAASGTLMSQWHNGKQT
jgi:hypothetical protein